jgi:hypothetical protein
MGSKVKIVSILSENGILQNYDGMIILDHSMILVKADISDSEYWLWFNKVSKDSYAIGVSSRSLDNNVYEKVFNILKKSRNNIEDAKSKILDLFYNSI